MNSGLGIIEVKDLCIKKTYYNIIFDNDKILNELQWYCIWREDILELIGCFENVKNEVDFLIIEKDGVVLQCKDNTLSLYNTYKKSCDIKTFSLINSFSYTLFKPIKMRTNFNNVFEEFTEDSTSFKILKGYGFCKSLIYKYIYTNEYNRETNIIDKTLLDNNESFVLKTLDLNNIVIEAISNNTSKEIMRFILQR